MSLLEDAEALLRLRTTDRRCKAVWVRDQLVEADREAYDRILMDRSLSGADVAGLLGRRNIHLSSSTVTQHRSGVCACTPQATT